MSQNLRNLYKKQIEEGCGQAVCSKVFCEQHTTSSISDRLSTILAKYDTLFLCRNYKLMFKTEKLYKKYAGRGSNILDFYLYLNEVLFGNENLFADASTEFSDEDFKKAAFFTKQTNQEMCKQRRKTRRLSIDNSDQTIISNGIKNLSIHFSESHGLTPASELDHSYCKLFKDTCNEVDFYVFVGVVQLLFRKYELQPNFALGVIIIRLYNIISRYTNLDNKSYAILYKILFNIKNLYSEEILTLPLSIDIQCDALGGSLERKEYGNLRKVNKGKNDELDMELMESPKRDSGERELEMTSRKNLNIEKERSNKGSSNELSRKFNRSSNKKTPYTASSNGSDSYKHQKSSIKEIYSKEREDKKQENSRSQYSQMNMQARSQNENDGKTREGVSDKDYSGSSYCIEGTGKASKENISSDEFDSQSTKENLDNCSFASVGSPPTKFRTKSLKKSRKLKSSCLYALKFTQSDFCSLVDTISLSLNSSLITDIRENRKIDNLLNSFHLLYLINEEIGMLGYKKFILNNFCVRMKFKEEFKHFRSKSKTLLNFPFILPVNIKAELIKYENSDLMKSSLQDSFFRALFEGTTEPYLFITVGRETIYKDTIRIFKILTIENARKQLRITFKGEEGVDSGGIRKEYFQLLGDEISQDNILFKNQENRLWINHVCENYEHYNVIGKIIGIALYNNVVLNIPFPCLFFKLLLGKKSKFEDLQEIQPEIYLSLSNLLKSDRDEIENLELYFTVDYEDRGELKMLELIPNGKNIKVRGENLKLFLQKYAEFHISTLIEKQMNAIKEGFYFIIMRNSMTYLDPKELESIIMGVKSFDVNILRASTIYNGYSDSSEIIVAFWKIFSKYDHKNKKKLLQFITGNDRIPISGPASLKLTIMKNGCDTERLPSSQTCFNTLLLPEYSSKEKLEKKLYTALEMTAGFYLL